MKVWLITRTLTEEDSKKLDIDNLPDWSDYNPLSLYRSFLKLGATPKILRISDIEHNLHEIPDIAMDCYPPWDGDKDKKILLELQKMGVMFVNEAMAHFKSFDKWYQVEVLTKANIRMPKSIRLNLPLENNSFKKIADEFQYPIVVKSTLGISGTCVFKCFNEDDVWDACKDIYTTKKYRSVKSKVAIAQEWIDHNDKGTIRVQIVGGKTIHIHQRRPATKVDFYKSNVKAGSIRTNYEIKPELAEMCESACDILGLDIAGLDVLHDGINYMVCEVNSTASLQGFDTTSGLDSGFIIAQYVLERFKSHESLATNFSRTQRGLV